MKQEEMFITVALSVTLSLIQPHFAARNKVFYCVSVFFFFFLTSLLIFCKISFLFIMHITSVLSTLILDSAKGTD